MGRRAELKAAAFSPLQSPEALSVLLMRVVDLCPQSRDRQPLASFCSGTTRWCLLKERNVQISVG